MVWGPLLLTVFVMINLIGAADDVGVFLEICGDVQEQGCAFNSHNHFQFIKGLI